MKHEDFQPEQSFYSLLFRSRVSTASRRRTGYASTAFMICFFFGLFLYFLILCAERLLVAIAPHDLDVLREHTTPSARRTVLLIEQIRPSMTALLLARLLLKVILAVFGTAAFLYLLTAMEAQQGLSEGQMWGLRAGGLVVLSLAFAGMFRLLKKVEFQTNNAGRKIFWLQRLSGYVWFWKTLFSPLIKKEKQPENKTPQNLEADQTAQQITEKRDIELLKSIVKFGDVTVKQVMQPRAKVAAIDFRLDFHELLAAVREAGFSRLPVYDEDFDNVTGILYVKDLVPFIDKDIDFEWQPLIRPTVMLVPESKRVSELLQAFKRQKIHLAIVVDEYGGSAGIVTMEDVLEEVTGDIRDEFDEESDIRYRKIDDANYLFEAQTLLNDVCRILGVAPETFDAVRGNADTLAGLALELRGDIPKRGTKIEWEGYLLTILASDNRRISQIKLTLK